MRRPRRATRGLAVAAAALLLLAPLPAQAAEEYGYVTFNVRNQAGELIDGSISVSASRQGDTGSERNWRQAGEPEPFEPGHYNSFEVEASGYHRQTVGPELGWLGPATQFDLAAGEDLTIDVTVADGGRPLLSGVRYSGTWEVKNYEPYVSLDIDLGGNAFGPLDKADTLNWKVVSDLDKRVLVNEKIPVTAGNYTSVTEAIKLSVEYEPTCTFFGGGRNKPRFNVTTMTATYWWASDPDSVLTVNHDTQADDACKLTIFEDNACAKHTVTPEEKAIPIGLMVMSLWRENVPGTFQLTTKSGKTLWRTSAVSHKFYRTGNIYKKLPRGATGVRLSWTPVDGTHVEGVRCSTVIRKQVKKK